jgi:hypothetical protein
LFGLATTKFENRRQFWPGTVFDPRYNTGRLLRRFVPASSVERPAFLRPTYANETACSPTPINRSFPIFGPYNAGPMAPCWCESPPVAKPRRRCQMLFSLFVRAIRSSIFGPAKWLNKNRNNNRSRARISIASRDYVTVV